MSEVTASETAHDVSSTTTVVARKGGLPVMVFAEAADFAWWLAREDGEQPGAWLMFARKGADATSLSRQEAIDAALCQGWIDGQTASWDDSFFLVRFTPRRPRSKWSQVNRARAEQLIEQGQMRPRGFEEVEAARADGRWAAAYPPSSTATVPTDFQAALDEHPAGAVRWAAMNRTARYEVLLGLANARRSETRGRRIAAFVAASGAEPAKAVSDVAGPGSRTARPIGGSAKRRQATIETPTPPPPRGQRS